MITGIPVGSARWPWPQRPPPRTGTSLLCFLLGTATPLSTAQLAALYPLHSEYVAAVARSAASAMRLGFVLPADALQLDADAAGSVTGLPAPTG